MEGYEQQDLPVGGQGSQDFALAVPAQGRADPVTYLKLQGGLRVAGSELMVQAFADYFQDLYWADSSSPCTDMPKFVKDLLVPSLPFEDRASLDAENTVDELGGALAQLQPDRAPELNGFPREYWHLEWPQMGHSML
ncbi:hypothetical protein NDU88_004603 [Pleurodeles waltl]|uniref:Uncharacterized protein n=1 Tax=Pleurodeles waltl TaxID=8319 RepID=A0AAV7PDJ9_PLEWA|nr:hypothetical protein NDU88_004603 [Pleurodeles waltl]